MVRPTVARVDLTAIEENLKAIAVFLARASAPARRTSDLGPQTSDAPRIIAVVKANAYGHGAADVALALERAGAAMLACADIEEGMVLRRAGVRAPILVFGALGISDLDGVFEYDLTPTISTPAAAANLEAAAARWFRPGSDRGQTRVRLGSDWGQTRVRPPVQGTQISERRRAL